MSHIFEPPEITAWIGCMIQGWLYDLELGLCQALFLLEWDPGPHFSGVYVARRVYTRIGGVLTPIRGGLAVSRRSWRGAELSRSTIYGPFTPVVVC